MGEMIGIIMIEKKYKTINKMSSLMMLTRIMTKTTINKTYNKTILMIMTTIIKTMIMNKSGEVILNPAMTMKTIIMIMIMTMIMTI